MPALSQVQLIGYLGKDPEGRFTPTGKKVAHFSVAVTQRWKVAGESRENTEWVNVEAWGRLGEVCQEYLKKGSLVYLDGRLKTDKYEDNGETKYFTKIVALSMQMLDRKPSDEPVMTVEEETQSNTRWCNLLVDVVSGCGYRAAIAALYLFYKEMNYLSRAANLRARALTPAP